MNKAQDGCRVRIYDNGGKTDDRYVAIYPLEGGRCYARSMSHDCDWLQGVNIMDSPPGGLSDPGRLGKQIPAADLPPAPQKQVIKDCREIYGGVKDD